MFSFSANKIQFLLLFSEYFAYLVFLHYMFWFQFPLTKSDFSLKSDLIRVRYTKSTVFYCFLFHFFLFSVSHLDSIFVVLSIESLFFKIEFIYSIQYKCLQIKTVRILLSRFINFELKLALGKTFKQLNKKKKEFFFVFCFFDWC